MKATLEFSLPDDEHEFKLAVNAQALERTLDELDEWLRGFVKYSEHEDWPDALRVREELFNLREAHGVRPE